MEKIKDLLKGVLKEQKNGIEKLIVSLPSTVTEAIELILRVDGKLIVSGIGKSGLIAQKIASSFSSTGTPAVFLHPAEAGHGDIGIVQKNDAIILFSFRGEQKEFDYFYRYCIKFNIPIIGITGNINSSLYKRSTYPILIPLENESVLMPFLPSVSTSVMLSLGDAMAVVVSYLKKFTPNDFAQLHPAGALGVLLNKKVSEIMHTKGSVPVINEDSEIGTILYTMSAKRLGCVLITDKDMNLSGIITDGDIRRALERFGKRTFDIDAKKMMTKIPKFIYQDVLAKDALEYMENNKITVLPVLNKKKKIAGILHLHDILGGKIQI